MMNKRNEKGFTLAELLIVVAIIAVLVAIAIPVFTTQLEKSREATDLSNVRAAYAEVMANYLANGAQGSAFASVTVNQKERGWQIGDDQAKLQTRVNGVEKPVDIEEWDGNKKQWQVKVDNTGTVTAKLK